MFEDAGVIEMFSRSKDTVVETWGESMGAVGGVALVTIALGRIVGEFHEEFGESLRSEE